MDPDCDIQSVQRDSVGHRILLWIVVVRVHDSTAPHSTVDSAPFEPLLSLSRTRWGIVDRASAGFEPTHHPRSSGWPTLPRLSTLCRGDGAAGRWPTLVASGCQAERRVHVDPWQSRRAMGSLGRFLLPTLTRRCAPYRGCPLCSIRGSGDSRLGYRFSLVAGVRSQDAAIPSFLSGDRSTGERVWLVSSGPIHRATPPAGGVST